MEALLCQGAPLQKHFGIFNLAASLWPELSSGVLLNLTPFQSWAGGGPSLENNKKKKPLQSLAERCST